MPLSVASLTPGLYRVGLWTRTENQIEQTYYVLALDKDSAVGAAKKEATTHDIDWLGHGMIWKAALLTSNVLRP